MVLGEQGADPWTGSMRSVLYGGRVSAGKVQQPPGGRGLELNQRPSGCRSAIGPELQCAGWVQRVRGPGPNSIWVHGEPVKG